MSKLSYPVIDLAATGKNIARLRKENGLRVTDLQSYLGLASSQSLYKWFRGDNLPTVDNLYALSRLFGISINDILVEEHVACDVEPDPARPPPAVRGQQPAERLRTCLASVCHRSIQTTDSNLEETPSLFLLRVSLQPIQHFLKGESNSEILMN